MALATFAPSYPNISSVTEGITATPSGTQVTALQLVSRYNRASVVATAGDAVLLPNWLQDMDIYVSNDAAAAMNVFPQIGQQIGASAVNAAFSVPAGKTTLFKGSGTSGKWLTVTSA